MNYHDRILQKKYLYRSDTQSYQKLICRLAILLLAYPPIARRFQQNLRHRRFIVHFSQRVLADMLQSDAQLQEKIKSLSDTIANKQLRDASIWAMVEEYCFQLVNHQPLFLHRLRQFCQSCQA